jgi:hypothetical protein
VGALEGLTRVLYNTLVTTCYIVRYVSNFPSQSGSRAAEEPY